jgi:hypothetical protein
MAQVNLPNLRRSETPEQVHVEAFGAEDTSTDVSNHPGAQLPADTVLARPGRLPGRNPLPPSRPEDVARPLCRSPFLILPGVGSAARGAGHSCRDRADTPPPYSTTTRILAAGARSREERYKKVYPYSPPPAL